MEIEGIFSIHHWLKVNVRPWLLVTLKIYPEVLWQFPALLSFDLYPLDYSRFSVIDKMDVFMSV